MYESYYLLLKQIYFLLGQLLGKLTNLSWLSGLKCNTKIVQLHVIRHRTYNLYIVYGSDDFNIEMVAIHVTVRC